MLLVAGCKVSTSGFGKSGSWGSGGAKEPGKVVIPNMFKMKKADEIAALKKAGFAGSLYDDSSLCGSVVEGKIIELGEVCYHHPVAGTETSARLPMTLRVQTEDPRHGKIGEFMEWHLMPQVVGMHVEKAKRAMLDAGFNEKKTRIDYREDPACKPNIVCRQYPEGMTRGGQGSDRVLVVGADPSAKPDKPEKPDPEKPDKPDPEKPDKPDEPDPFF